MLTKTVSGKGSVVADPSRTKFKKGESVALKAVPDKGWEFVSWNGASNSSSTQTTMLMDGNKKVTAVFKQTPLFYALNVSKTGEGTVSVSPKSSKYTAGSVVTATAQPASGWQFDHWEGHANGKNSTLKIVMNEEKSIRAVFTKKEQQVVQVNKPVEKEEPAKQEQPVKQKTSKTRTTSKTRRTSKTGTTGKTGRTSKEDIFSHHEGEWRRVNTKVTF